MLFRSESLPTLPNVRPATLADLLRARAAEHPEREAYLFLVDGEEEGARLTWGELDRRARAVAAVLRESLRPGDRALLLYPPGLDFVAAFFGCLYAGVVAVPAYPPRPHDRAQARLRAIARDAGPQAALTTEGILPALAVVPELGAARWIATEGLQDGGLGEPADFEGPEPESVAFLQYTSGSTAEPKGVMVTHANLLHNEAMIGEAFRQGPGSVVVGWLPLYHDMGLIGNVLQPLHAGGRCVLMSPVAFLQRPRRWLEAVSRYGGTTSGGPNFAYDLCVRRIPPEQRAGLDLRSWRLAFNGAEPVRAETMARFAEAFAPCGFDPAAFYPCYGLAEATLFVSGGTAGTPPRVENGKLVSCGHAWGGQRIAIADPETGAALPPGIEGEVWVAGPSVAAGYWRNPEATERDFRARLASGEGPFLRTGDLGALVDGELFVTGRLKDLIILRGRNLYPQDVERTAEAADPDLRPGGSAAFAVEQDGEERLVIVAEVERRRRGDLQGLAEAVRQAVAEEHEAQAAEVVLVRPGGVPKTSSGKVRRSACRDAWRAGELPVLERSTLAPGMVTESEDATVPDLADSAAVERFLRARAAAALGLPVAAIDPERPLTAYGLDSLAALELKGGVEAALGATLPLAELLAGAGTARLAELALLPPLPGVGRAVGEGGRGGEGLSFGEKALWFLDRLAPEAGAYNIAVAARVHGGTLDIAALRRAFAALIARHEVLRTVFPLEGDAPVRRVVSEKVAAVDVREAGGEDAAGWEPEMLAAWLAEEAWRPFDVAAGPLLRLRVLTGASEGQVLLLAVHHLVADFWSLAVIARELAALYRDGSAVPRQAGRSAADFARWQAEMVAGPRGEALWESWRQALAGVPDLDLPTDRPRPPVQTWGGLSRAAVLPAEEAAAVRALAAGRGATLFAALLAAFQAQLGRYAGQEDFAVGTPTAGRGAPEWADVVGYLVNPVALRSDLGGGPGFGELVERARRTAVAALEGADLPFAWLAERLRPTRDPARPPVFQTMLALQQKRAGDAPELPAFALGEDGARIPFAGLELESVGWAERRAQFEVTLNAAELADGGLGLSLEVNADLFDAATAERMLGHFRTLLAAAVAEPERPAAGLPLLTAAERGQLAAEWSASAAPVVEVPPLTLHAAFVAVAARAPEATAVEVEGDEEALTYRELAARAAGLAHQLRRLGVGPEVPVALCVERSADLAVGLLGILESGGVYLPLDPDHSAARLGFVLEDAGAAALVTQRRIEGRLPATAVPRLYLEDLAAERTDPPPERALPESLAYLIYTSGSTGRPKGVAVSHGAALAHCLTWAHAYGLGAADRVLQFSSPGFDASIEQVFAALLSGATLVLRGHEPWGTADLGQRMAALRLTVADFPTAFWGRWIAEVAGARARTDRSDPTDRSDLTAPATLRLVGIGGEELRAETARQWRATPLARVPLLNSYGPTEAVISATLHAVAPERAELGPEPIGLSLPGRVARVLDREGNPQPVGVPGELCLGGVLARGYLGRPDLTAERFVPDPFAGAPGERLYRSGDRVRRRTDGAIEFLGRFDDQVKVRGFRIEPGEIEAVLAGHPEVREAAVLALGAPGTDERRLVGFVVAMPSAALDFLALRRWLGARLPDYMVPAAWVSLPALPLNPSGKVDRSALAALAPSALAAEEPAAGEAPRTPEEEILADLFAELLGRERVGIHDDFFALGGHSLLATRAVARIARLFGADVPVSSLFQAPTAAGLAARLAAGIAGAATAPPLRPLPRTAGAPLQLSFAQQRLWFLDQLEPGTAVYNLPGAVDLAGPLSVPALAAALTAIIARHEALRTVYGMSGGEPVQRIMPPAAQALSLVDLSGLPEGLCGAAAELRGREEARAPFDLARGPVCRTLLLRLGAEAHRLLVTFHHIAADGWSLGLFLDELTALLAGGTVPALPVQYADWAAWQRGWLHGEELERQLSWWRGRLAGLPVLELPADRPRPPVRDPRGGSRARALPAELAAAVGRLARREGATPFMALLVAFQTLLARLTGEAAVPVGSPVANRRRVEAEPLIGLFVNTLVLDARLGDDPSFGALLARVRAACLGAYAHQDLPFEALVQELQPERDLGQNPLFQVMLVLDEPLPARQAGALDLAPRRSDATVAGTARFDLMLAVTPQPDGGWEAVTEHAAALFEPVTIDRLLGHFATLLEGAVADPAARLSALPLLTAAERAQLAEWNDTGSFPAGPRLHDLVEEQAARTPDAEAVVGEEERITYRELVARARGVAGVLRRLGVGPEVRVGLCLRRTPDLLAAILGVLTAGGAYVPLDPAYPQERLELMLADSGAGVLWTERALAGRFAFFGGATVLAEEAAEGAPLFTGSSGTDGGADAGGLAYAIYTSGSTGRPKGVGIEHRSAVALVRWALGVFPPEDLRGVLAATSVCFDLSIFEIFVPLAAGGRVILAPGVLELPQLAAIGEVTLVNAVPSPMAELVRGRLPAGLRTVNLAGEALKPDLVERIYAHPQVERVVNLYGPSEDTTYSTWTTVPRGAPVTIGRPIAGTQAWVLGRQGEALPVGAVGELCLGGDGLARGYLGRPELTAEKFIPDPFGAPGSRLYRTGDRARRRADGEIEFLGRFDHQVKLRGQRIELGEIEVMLESCPAVAEAVVMMRSDAADDQRLVGYLIPALVPGGDEGGVAAVTEEYLRERLPPAMVPATWVVLDAFPRSPNGKVDRRALPAPEQRERAAIVAPRTPTEEMLAGVFREVLGVEEVGVHDGFFDLGGHSLLAVRAAFRIAETAGVDVPVSALFQAPTVAGLAGWLDGQAAARPTAVERAAGATFPLSLAQQRLWLIDRREPGNPVYNVSVAVRLAGELRAGHLAAALTAITRRHEPLRTVYAEVEGESVQVVLPPQIEIPLPRLDLDGLPAPRREVAFLAASRAEAERPFDLERGPVARYLLIRLGAGEQILLAAFHHIAVDGWSIEIFFRELAAFYGAAVEGRPALLPALPVRYGDVSLWQRRALAEGALEPHLDWWRRQLAGVPVLDLPTDRPRPTALAHRGAARSVALPAALAGELRALGRAEGATLFATLLAGLATLLARTSGQGDLPVGVPSAGRGRPETEGLIGFFVSTLVLRIGTAGDPGFRELARRVQAVFREAQAHEAVPFEWLLQALQPERVPGYSPLFQVMFSFFSASGAPLRMPGLEMSLADQERRVASHDLTLALHEDGAGVRGALEYRTDLFEAAAIDRMAGHLLTLLTGAAATPERRISDLPLLTPAESWQILGEWTGGPAAAPARTLHELVAERAAEAPEALAVLGEDGTAWTRRELEARAEEIAAELRRLGAGPESAVVLCLERSPWLVAGFLGILKAGGFCVPVDPEHGVARLAFVVEDARAAAVVASRGVKVPAGAPVLWVGREDWGGGAPLPGRSGGVAGEGTGVRALAYAIYTSGSTGTPKGVAVSHAALIEHCLTWAASYGMGADDRVLQFASAGFDASVEQIFSALLSGAALAVRGPGLWSTRELPRRIAELGLTIADLPTAFWNRWVHDMEDVREVPGRLRLVGIGGEELTAENARRWSRTPLAGALLLNSYGPTEAVVSATLHAVLPGDGEERPVPIGRPLPGRTARVLDRAGHPQPMGVPGELCLGGPLARGYLGNPALTAERFVPDPFAGLRSEPGARLYRSGDLARHRADGAVEFLGRIDRQLKVRGFRVEPGEIEAALAAHPAVREAAVLALEGADGRRLGACVVPAAPGGTGDGELTSELRDFLRRRLPAFMVPSLWAVLPAFPLSVQGKVDRRALERCLAEAPAASDRSDRSDPTDRSDPSFAAGASASPVAELLAALWSDLLGVERVGAGDDFFERGGDSLLATRLVSRVWSAFHVELPLAALFEAPTPAALARRIEVALAAAEDAPVLPPPERLGASEGPLSFSQQRLWFLHQLEPASTAYHVPGAARLRGDLRPEVLERALGEIVRRHEALRTVFPAGGAPAGPVQAVLPPPPLPLPVVDLSALPAAAQAAETERRLAEQARLLFDLELGPLVRTALLRLGPAEQLLAVTMHHIVSDAWSLGIMLRELSALYPAFAAGRPSPLPELPLQYLDYAAWQRRSLTGAVLERETAYWRGVLDGAPPTLELPYDRPRPAAPTQRGERRPFAAPAGLAAALRTLSRREGWTLFMTLFAAFQALLARYGGHQDAVVGSPIANRNRLETEGVIGFFTNTLALRLDLSGDPEFRTLAGRARAVALEAYAHQELPFERLVEELAPERQVGLNPLFQVMLVVQKSQAAALALPGIAAELLDVDPGIAKFDLTLMLFEEEEGGLGGTLEHDRDLFDPATADRMLGHFRTLLDGVAADPGSRLSALPLLTAAERAELAAWTRPISPGPVPRLVHERVAAQALRSPDAEAVVAAGERLTYAGLVRRARRLARRLAALGVEPDVPVGIFMQRSPEMMVALLAVLEAGGAYLPLDPGYPRERLRLMLEDAGAPVLLTDRALAGAVPAGAGVVLPVEPEEDGDGAAEPPLFSGVDPENLVYVVYTSGSMGRPKGVAMTHAAISAMLDWQLRTSAAGAGRTLQFTSLSFDVSFQEIFSTWTAGGAVVLVSEDVRRDPPALLSLLAAERVERLFLPFVALQQLAVAAASGPRPEQLREVMSAGEQLYVTPQVAALFAGLPGAELHNHYGPSETHAVTWLALTGDSGDPGAWPERPTIGVPLDHARVLLLDRWQRRAPRGVAGEIWVGGAGLARGYLARPDLTAERFLPDPFAEVEGWQPGDRLYRTGDLARLLPEGTLEFLGRADAQVKVRGQRIEPAEVETALARHPAVLQAAVAVRGASAGARRLVAYVVFRVGIEPPAFPELKAFLADTLPDPMVPSAWARLDALPLTPSGKLDRRALARVAPEAPEDTHRAFEPPRDPVEEALAAIWREVLGVERVDVHDDFFALGGHSLLATQVASRVRETFRVELPLRRLFEAPTVAGLAREVEAALAAADQADGGAEALSLMAPIAPAPRDGDLPLSFSQERLWFLDRLQPGTAYSLPLALRLRGPLDVPAFAAALAGIERRHESVRTVFAERDGEPRQVVLPPSAPRLPMIDLSALPAAVGERVARELAAAEAARPFDLARGPLLRALLLRLGPAAENHHLLFLTMHHIVSDGWSMGVLVREAGALYEAARSGLPSPLPDLPIQYADFAVWQRRRLAGATRERLLGWWRERLAGAPAALDLPTDRPRPALQSFRGAEHRFALDAELSAGLAALARQAGATPFMVLAAGLLALLSQASGQSDLTLGAPVANRNRLETEGLIGFFVNTLVLRAAPGRAASFLDLLREVRDTTLGAYAHQDLPFEALVAEMGLQRDLSHTPFFQVSLVLQNAPLPDAAFAGLEIAAEEQASGTAKLDLAFALREEGRGFAAVLEYATDLFDPATAARLADHWRALLAAAAAAPLAHPLELSPLAAAERHQLLHEWNDTATADAAAPGVFLHDLVAAQAARTPGAPAVSAADGTLTYAELDRRVAALALHLRAFGVGPEEVVGLHLDRSTQIVVALLAVLAAGGAWLPLDPAYPRERLAFLARDSGAKVVLTEPALAGRLAELAREVVLPADGEMPGEMPDADTGGAPLLPENAAYLIYTSGSTGMPKGVLTTHRTLTSSMLARIALYGPPEAFLLLTPFAFDASVPSVFCALCTGGRLVISPAEAMAEPPRLAALIARERVTTFISMPSLWTHLVEQPELAGLPGAVVAGEALPFELVERHFALLPSTRLWNEYGPTEATVWSSSRELAAGQTKPVTLGRPSAGVRFLVVDGGGQPAPIGVPGELWIGGTRLGRGYHGQPALTAAAFVPDPFAAAPGARVYRTGDLVRTLADGEVQFLGRIDHQVKVRGFRIELGEIEAALARVPGIREAVVAARRDPPGEPRLVAYLVPAGGESRMPVPEEIRTALARTLPEYMVPWTFVTLDALPLNATGKLDRRALPAPGEARGKREPIAPRTGLEKAIGEVWREVLHLERVDVDESFFEAGGNSLLLARLHARLRQALGQEIPFVDLFRHPTIESLARSLEAAGEGEAGKPQDGEARARTDTRREAMRQLQQRRAGLRGQRKDGGERS
jgi:amino acid adenylation domain-containing protein